MKTPVSLTVPQFERSPQVLLDLCRRAPGLGVAGLFSFDHLVPIGDPTRPVLEGASVLGMMAATVASPLRTGSLVLRATLRPPPVTVALAETLVAVAASPPVIGLGVGDRLSAREGDRYGMPPRSLGERLEVLAETLRLLRMRVPRAEVWVGGIHPRVRSLAALADGWNGWGLATADLARLAGELTAVAPHLKLTWGGGVLLASSQRKLAEVLARRARNGAVSGDDLVVGTPAQVIEGLSSRAELVDEMVLSILPNRPASWELFASEVLPTLP